MMPTAINSPPRETVLGRISEVGAVGTGNVVAIGSITVGVIRPVPTNSFEGLGVVITRQKITVNRKLLFISRPNWRLAKF